jgi:hypothetical protein
MFSRFQQPLAIAARQFSTTPVANRSVAVMGASGGKVDFFVMRINRSLNYYNLQFLVALERRANLSQCSRPILWIRVFFKCASKGLFPYHSEVQNPNL